MGSICSQCAFCWQKDSPASDDWVCVAKLQSPDPITGGYNTWRVGFSPFPKCVNVNDGNCAKFSSGSPQDPYVDRRTGWERFKDAMIPSAYDD